MASTIVEQIRVGKLGSYVYVDEDNDLTIPFESPLVKRRIKGRLWLTQTGIIGDDGIDEKEKERDKSLFAYPIEHYSYWKKRCGNQFISVGQMGENLVLKGQTEYDVFIGDTYQFGEAIIQVSQPRLPCWRVAYHLEDFQFAKKIKESGLIGWHYRILKEGFVKEACSLTLIERPYLNWSIARCFELLYKKDVDLTELDQLMNCSSLSSRWQRLMKQRLYGRTINDERRLLGPILAYK